MTLTFGLPSEPSKMAAANDGEARVSQRPSIAIGAGNGRVKGRRRAWLLSGVVSANVLILGCALVSGSAFSDVNVSPAEVQIFLTILLLLTIAWMLFYTAYTAHRDGAVLYKDGHAGPIWLRGGLVLFGIFSLIMDVFKIANYTGYTHCDSAVKIVYPAVQAVFILVQTYFLWFHAKDCVQVQKNVTCCGLMLLLSTNLMIWMASVTEESLHQTDIPDNSTARALEDNDCHCSHSACEIFEEAYQYLYPFNIEYSLFASAMAYIMWKNVGRLVDEHAHHHHPHPRFRFQGVLLGPTAGLVMLVAGLATFVVYEVDVKSSHPVTKWAALDMHYTMNTAAACLMSASSLGGLAVYWLDKRGHVSGKNPTRLLDVALLLGASLGQMVICYFTAVAVVATGIAGETDALNLACSLLTLAQLCLQNLFIIEGLHRQPFDEAPAPAVFANAQAHALEGTLPPAGIAVIETKSHSVAMPEPTTQPGLSRSWKRWALKEICAFLLLGNIILWIMPAFGARPQFDNPIGLEFYKSTMWVPIVNIALPFAIFYRMHSVASLFEVFLIS
ncbi:proton channel OTOP2 isoform X1 [Anguilla anguilla]|uniref:proton channel OTOP2 isoform X1 n=2 Tax=Anguilla anguilla TaxID=7936 RepID=UPI0015B09FE9|nr:proton channel OTOP2 isoform X1 [Anguilla anguilla]